MPARPDRLKVLFLPAWYPAEDNPTSGIFIKEHAKAASLFNDIIVMYAYPDPLPPPRGICRISDEIEDGIRTLRIRYGGIFSYFSSSSRKARKASKPKGQKAGSSNESYSQSFIQQSSQPSFMVRLIGFIPTQIITFLYYWSLLSTFRKLTQDGWKPDIIHAHVYNAGVPAVVLSKLYKIPVVITEHSSEFPRHLLTRRTVCEARFAMNRADVILPVSANLGTHIRSYGINARFQVVPNAVDTRLFKPQITENRNNKDKKLLFVGGLTPIKGIPYLLEAASDLLKQRKDFTLDIVGDGSSRLEYEYLSANLGLNGIVTFQGFQPKEKVSQFMMNCTFFILPSLWENLPCVLIEAIACGKPVIASDVGGVNEIVNRENGILTPSGDSKTLRERIEFMLDNYMNFESQTIAEHATRKYSYETVGRLLDEVYQEVTK